MHPQLRVGTTQHPFSVYSRTKCSCKNSGEYSTSRTPFCSRNSLLYQPYNPRRHHDSVSRRCGDLYFRVAPASAALIWILRDSTLDLWRLTQAGHSHEIDTLFFQEEEVNICRWVPAFHDGCPRSSYFYIHLFMHTFSLPSMDEWWVHLEHTGTRENAIHFTDMCIRDWMWLWKVVVARLLHLVYMKTFWATPDIWDFGISPLLKGYRTLSTPRCP